VITTIAGEFNPYDPLDLRYDIAYNQHVLLAVSGYGITANDYIVSGTTLTIKSSFAKYFTKPQSYSFKATFAKAMATITKDFSFQVVDSKYPYQITNGGFETGDYLGWNGYQVWKDESGMFSYRSERIVNTANYGSSNANAYNRDGQYHLGVYAYPYVNANKDLNQERMGMLRSSDFVLGGSGWIGFKLGGGQNPGTAYISIKNSVTNIEVARYANRHFGKTIVSGTDNAEAYMFQYYADLSSHIGEELYVLAVDAASHEWNVLSLDSVVTYMPTTPTPTPNQLATDIKPNINGLGTATNAMSNPLSANVNLWEDPSGIFRYQDGSARTNAVMGDGALGVVRSPSFKIVRSANRYLVWEWEGSLMLDKQIFLSVKETLTNNEVVRLVRRDNLSTKSSGGMDKHWYDLGGLSEDKEYYIELTDNAKSSWGLISLRNINLAPEGDSHIQVATDVAVNCFYGLGRVDFTSGGYRSASDYSYDPVTTVMDGVVSLGVNAGHEAIIGYRTNSNNTWTQYRQAGGATLDASLTSSSFEGMSIKRGMLQGLLSANTYQYRFGDRGQIGPWRSFKTPDPDEIVFSWATDSQALSLEGAKVFNRLVEKAVSIEPKISFGLLTGDTVEQGADDKMWQWFSEATIKKTDMPFMAIPGNHDYYDGNSGWLNNSHFEAFWPHPTNGYNGYSSYYFNIGPALFVMVDSVDTAYGQSQINWFNQAVSAANADIVIVGTHYSAYGGHHLTTSAAFRDVWAPVFDANHVDLVLSGHDHLFTRTPPMRDGSVNRTSGTIYVSGGSASEKIYDVPSELFGQYDYYLPYQTNVVTIFTITSTTLSAKTVTIDGVQIDNFSINIS